MPDIPYLHIDASKVLQTYDEVPVCFVRAVQLRKEMPPHPGPKERLYCIQRNRDCDSFTTWIQGFTPKEHREMILSEETLKLQREEQAAERQERRLREEAIERRENADRVWRDKQARKEHRWKRAEAKWRRKELWVMGFIVTLVSVAAQIVSAFIERGDLFKSRQPEPGATVENEAQGN